MNSALQQAISIAEDRFNAQNSHARNVMVALIRSFGNERCRHLKLFRDENGLYVRLGKRGAVKRYLATMADARIVDAGLKLAVFYERG